MKIIQLGLYISLLYIYASNNNDLNVERQLVRSKTEYTSGRQV